MSIFSGYYDKKITHTWMFWIITLVYLLLWSQIIKAFVIHGGSLALVTTSVFTVIMWLYLPYQHFRHYHGGRTAAKITYVLVLMAAMLASVTVGGMFK